MLLVLHRIARAIQRKRLIIWQRPITINSSENRLLQFGAEYLSCACVFSFSVIG